MQKIDKKYESAPYEQGYRQGMEKGKPKNPFKVEEEADAEDFTRGFNNARETQEAA